MRVGVIGGTGFARLVPEARSVVVETRFGEVTVEVAPLPGAPGREVVFLPRHGRGHVHQPHRIAHEAHLTALAACGVEVVLGVNNTGGLREDLHRGDLVVPHDLVDLTGAVHTVLEDQPVHVDMTEPYCPALRTALVDGANAAAWSAGTLHQDGVYVQTRGPRLETPAEVRFYATLGDVVGMTGAPEAAIARELGLCYASLCFVANEAAGRQGQPLDPPAIQKAMADRTKELVAVLEQAIAKVPEVRGCTCATAPERGRLTTE